MTAVAYYLKPGKTRLPAGTDPTLEPPVPVSNPLRHAFERAALKEKDTSPGPTGTADPPPVTFTSPAPSAWPRLPVAPVPNRPLAEIVPNLPDLDPDIAMWPVTIISRWPFTGAPTTGIWPRGWMGVDNTATLYICTAGGSPGTWASIGGSGGFTNPFTGPLTINVPLNGLNGLNINLTAGAEPASQAVQINDSAGQPIITCGATGGWVINGDRQQAAPGVYGPWIALDGTVNPPAILFPSGTYGAGGRIWGGNNSPAADWVSGTTKVNDLWINFNTGQILICTVSGAGTGPGTWVAYSTSGSSLTFDAGNLSSPFTGTGSPATFLTTSSLAVGTWLVTLSGTMSLDAVVGEIKMATGTAGASVAGNLATQIGPPEVSAGLQYFNFSLSFEAQITAAGTLVFLFNSSSGGEILSTTPGSSFPNATGYTALKVA